MRDEEPILVIAPSDAVRWYARLLSLGLFLMSVVALVRVIGESETESWVLALVAASAMLFLWQAISAFRGYSWAIRLMEDRIVCVGRGYQSEFPYSRILGFRLNRLFSSKSGPGALTVLFEDAQYVKIPVGHEFDVMEIIQSRVDHEIPGYEKQHLTITGK